MLLKDLRDCLQKLINHKITNDHIGSILDTSSQNISKRMNGNSEVTVSELEKIQDYFGVNIYIKTDVTNSGIVTVKLKKGQLLKVDYED